MRISASQVRLHRLSEAAAVLIGVPLLLSAASSERLSDTQRRSLKAMAIATLVIDGYLLTRWSLR